jgi:hypothetical protein
MDNTETEGCPAAQVGSSTGCCFRWRMVSESASQSVRADGIAREAAYVRAG